MSGEKKHYLANLPAKMDLRTLAATIKARWICEQAHQQLKEELGLDHFEGRSWQGLHRHALMTMIAYAFLQHRRLAAARREKKNQRATASANFASRALRHPRTHRSTTARSVLGENFRELRSVRVFWNWKMSTRAFLPSQLPSSGQDFPA
jgi:hypothetical protein